MTVPLRLQTDGASCNSALALWGRLCPPSQSPLSSGLPLAEVSHGIPSQEPWSSGNYFSKGPKYGSVVEDLGPFPKIPMNFFLQTLTISPTSFLRQVLGLTTETHFEELVKSFCRCVEFFPLEIPQTGAAPTPFRTAIGACTSSCIRSLGWEGWEWGKCSGRLQDQMGCLSTSHYNFTLLKINTNTVKEE